MADINGTAKNPKKDYKEYWDVAKIVLIRVGKILLRVLSYVLNILFTILLIGLICGVIVGTVFAIYIKNYVDPEIDSSLLRGAGSDTTTRMFYMDYENEDDRINEDGTAVELEDQRLYSSDNSIWVKYEDIPDDLVNAFIAIEDHRFKEHNGVDWIRTGKAVFGYFLGSGDFGGSTITQQLIKNLTGDDEVSPQRKVQEIFRAINLENEMSKEQILEMYLNIVFLGNNCYGVQTAANTYFDKDVSELTLVECAALASIVKNPSKYEPLRHDVVYYENKETGEMEEDGNRARRNDVIFRMHQLEMISDDERDAGYETELVLKTDKENSRDDTSTVNSWYTDAVINDVQQALMDEYGYSSYVASLMIYSGGLQIYTCMDPDVQETLETVYENDGEYLPAVTDGLQPESAMIVIDPYTGDVLGLVGGRGQKTQNRIMNRATQSKRPAGSCIKPVSVYGPAIDLGVATMASTYDDTPVRFDEEKNAWPHNLPDIYRGITNVKNALRHSINTVAVKMLQDVTVDYSFDFIKNTLHMDSVIESYTKADGTIVSDKDLAPLALGQFSYGITLWELTAGYTMFQNDGIYSESRLWYKVLDSDGNVILENEPEYEIAISEEAASIMTVMMQDVITNGTGTAITLDQKVNVAGKTGTTTADFDRWFIGYTPYYVGGVWTGYDMNQSLSDFGQNPSLQIWDTVMTMLHQDVINAAASGGEPIKKFELSDKLVEATYCKDSGMLVSDACKLDPEGNRTEKAYFTKDTLPTEYCTTHVLVAFDKTTNRVANPNCPAETLVYKALRNVDRNFPVQITVVDTQYTTNSKFDPLTMRFPTVDYYPFYHYALEGGFTGITNHDKQYNAVCQAHSHK